jgi:hypothetical protein
MPPVDLAGDGPSGQAGFLPIGWNHHVVRHTEPADWRYQEVPDSSIYLPLMRAVGHIAGSFAELPNAARFIRTYPRIYSKKEIGRMHI